MQTAFAGWASHIGLKVKGKMERNIHTVQSLSDETKECMRNFKPDISHTMPGIKGLLQSSSAAQQSLMKRSV